MTDHSGGMFAALAGTAVTVPVPVCRARAFEESRRGYLSPVHRLAERKAASCLAAQPVKCLQRCGAVGPLAADSRFDPNGAISTH